MILNFYDKDFKKIANNTALVIDRNNYKLIKRPVKLNDFSCICEPFTADVQPTFLIVYDDIGRNIIYSSLAGVPRITSKNKTQITGTDLKTLLSSDVILKYESYTKQNTISDVINYVFNEWNNQVNQGSFNYEVVFLNDAENVKLDKLLPSSEQAIYNALEEISSYLSVYDLYIDTELNLKDKKIVFKIGKILMSNDVKDIKLWEYDFKNYGKFIADLNEAQGYYDDGTSNWTAGLKWILTSNNELTIDTSIRDIYPIKRAVFVSKESLQEAENEAIMSLLNSRYNENLDIPITDFNPTFSTSFKIYIKKNNIKMYYKTLPCGELRYNYNGLYEFQIGFRYTGINFI